MNDESTRYATESKSTATKNPFCMIKRSAGFLHRSHSLLPMCMGMCVLPNRHSKNKTALLRRKKTACASSGTPSAPTKVFTNVVHSEAEPHATEHYAEHAICMPKQSRNFFKCAMQNEFLKQQKRAVVQAPKYEIPMCAMPNAREHPHYKNVPHRFCRAATISAERNVDIFAKPCTQRNVPTPPEFRDAF